MIRFNETDVRKFYKFFKHKNPTELRMFTDAAFSVWCATEDDFAEQVKMINHEKDVYIGARDRLHRKDKNIISSNCIFFETDVLDQKEKICEFLKNHSLKLGMCGMSGRGHHFYIPHAFQSLDNDEDRRTYKQFLTAFKTELIENGIEIDPSIFNLERVMRVLGTFNHRRNVLSSILEYNKLTEQEIDNNSRIFAEIFDKRKSTLQYTQLAPIDNEWLGKDLVLQYALNNIIVDNTQRDAVLLKNLAIGFVQSGLTDVQICEDIGKKIIANCPGKNINELMGWVNKSRAGELRNFNKLELNAWIKRNKLPIELYKSTFDTQLVLPKLGKLISEFATEVSDVLKKENNIFFRSDSREIVEIGEIPTKQQDRTYTGFITVNPSRFITLVERFFVPGHIVKVEHDNLIRYEFKQKSITRELANTVLQSPMLEESLSHIDRIFTVPLPIIIDNQLVFPKMGYDERFDSWLPYAAPKIIDPSMTVVDAKKLFYDILHEFCFKNTDGTEDKNAGQDYANAVAAIGTPFCRGLYSQFNCRTPVWVFLGNRERVGKDYLAGIIGILYEGEALEEPPINEVENRGNSSEELRKKILAAFLAGRKRLHFSNNKGHLNNAVFESIITARTWSDRILGKNISPIFNNELEFSMSGNVGITFTADFVARARFVNLFWAPEDMNARTFKNPNLHEFVRNNRSEILSAIYVLVKNWFDKGCPAGTVPFASYPEWARVVGGIMEAAGYLNPCNKSTDVEILTTDPSKQEMMKLYALCYDRYKGKKMSKRDIRDFIIDENNSGADVFNYLDFNNRSDQIKFGILLTQYSDRELCEHPVIVMKNVSTSTRSSRQEFVFEICEAQQDSQLKLGDEEK